MCGFAGTVFFQPPHSPDLTREQFVRYANRVAHRGNDDARNLFLDTIWLQHFRLAFQDVAGSTQPWLSPDGKYVLVFNGEIYNHHQLRPDILKTINYAFTTRGDTETIMAGFLAYGPEIFQKLEGEFSIVVMRTDGSELWATRDWFGVKPLFFSMQDVDTNVYALAKTDYAAVKSSRLHFASEIKGLAVKKTWNNDGALRQFVGLYEPIRTPFQSIIHVPPGGLLHAQKRQDGFFVTLKTNPKAVRAIQSQKELRSYEELQHQLADVMRQSVQNRLLSDVELGVYLSGGIDSKVVAFELSKLQSKSLSPKPKSFTVGFSHNEYDETAEALKFAAHLGFHPHVVKINDEALTYSYPLAVATSENLQPYTNGAAKWWLSLFTRQHVRGVLTGDGADELWGGYPSFKYTSWWEFSLKARSGKTVFDKLRNTPLGSHWRDDVYRKRFANFDKNPWQSGSSAVGIGTDFVKSLSIWGVAHPLFEQIETIATAVLGSAKAAQDWLLAQGESVRSWFALGLCSTNDESFLTDPKHTTLLWQNYFCKTHLPVQVLNWVGDRMEMANTLEGRTPFLSKEMREFVFNLTHTSIMAGFRDKALLRSTYGKRFPAAFAATPKKQFGAPFLDFEKLHRNFQTNQLERMLPWIGEGANRNTIQNLEASIAQTQNPFLKTHFSSVKQTLLCSAIVYHTLIQENELTRDETFESSFIRT